MEGIARIGDQAIGPKLLNLMPNCREEVSGQEEEKKLELRLGLAPPGERGRRHHHNLNLRGDGSDLDRGLLLSSARSLRSNVQHKSTTHFDLNLKDVKGEHNTTTTTTFQKRTAPGPVVGWPPVRSFRKNITANSINNCLKRPSSSHDAVEANNKSLVDGEAIDGGNHNYQMIERPNGSMFVKINMEGVAIGRKVDLGAYDTYDKLSSAVDVLFRDLLAVQRDGGEEAITTTEGVDGRGEYTIVYEDNEGDRMLLGDVPWHMFVSTVKRLRVLKTSELSSHGIGGRQER
ncbi:hypothetical protein MLD38_007170 [Melastoma candidum]|uniref:Uncharacterized protein n=1 Tax=Melastoma candidum TaxID=119954 RepID=A0ACB9RRL3_9MYRT|nr:hypothetical protein MLD38_007170 [Melastoma candidum]